MPLLIGLDLGTTSIKAVLFDSTLKQVTRIATRKTPVSHPQPDWSEHDPEAVWQAVVDCLSEISAGLAGKQVVGLAASSLAEAGLPLDPDGKPLYPIIAWYDRRSEPQVEWIERSINVANLYAITGQRASPSFSITKILWFRKHEPRAYQHMACWLPLSAYILWRLTGEKVTDYTIAARTLLFDQRQRDWSPELLDLFQLSAELLPRPMPGGSLAGRLTRAAAQATRLPAGTLVCLGGHDHLCAAFACGAYAPGAVADSTGSAEAVVALVDRFLPDPSLGEAGYACYAGILEGLYVLKGGLKAAGSGIEWLARRLTSPGREPDWTTLEAAARLGVGKRAGPLWLPHLNGSGSPESDRLSRAALVGARFEHDQGDLFRGMLESLACWLRYNLEVMREHTGQGVSQVLLTGGVTRIKLLSQLKADLLHQPVSVPDLPESAATGAALLSGLGTGVFSSPREAVQSLAAPQTVYQPDPTRVDWYDRLYQDIYRPLYSSLKEVNQRLQQMDQT